MIPGTLLVRADANVQIGTGHVMRCLALAQAWHDAGGDVVFACAEFSAPIEERLRAERIHLAPLHTVPGSAEDSALLKEVAAHNRPAWIVVDGYQFSADYHLSVRSSGRRVLVVDDCGTCAPNGADMVLNQNLHARREMYRDLKAETKLLLGPRFALLRREFTRWRGWRRETRQVGRKILITMGGSDAENRSAWVCEALQGLPVDGVEIRVAVGSTNPHLAFLQSIAEKSEGRLRVEQNVNDMSELMVWADVAISSAGSTCWEICRLGLPSVLLVVAENQRPVAADLSRMGIAIEAVPDEQFAMEKTRDTVRELLVSRDLREKISQRACALVDGLGADRVVAAMRAQAIRVRAAQGRDCELLWGWTNDTSVRQVSFESSPVPWEEHSRWFARKLQDPSSMVLMFEDDDSTPAGTARFYSKSGRDAEISVTIAPAFRGQGLARHLLNKAVEHAFEHGPLERIHAFVKTENRVSAKSFANAGFFLVGTTHVKGKDALHYLRERGAAVGDPCPVQDAMEIGHCG